MNLKSTAIFAAFSLITTLALPATSTVSGVSSKAVRWHPGHYVLVPTNASTSEIQSQLNACPKFRGIQKEYLWNQLENNGAWHFESISQDLKTLRLMNKHLVIQLQCKSFGVGPNHQPSTACPSNLRGSAKAGGGYYSGVYKTSTGSLDPAIWDGAVTARMKLLYKALATYLNADPNVQALEAVCLSETAVSSTAQLIAASGAKQYLPTDYLTNLTDGFKELSADLPHTVVIQYTNFSVDYGQLVTNEKNNAVGLGGPDLDPTGHPSLQAPRGAYQQYLNMKGDQTHPNAIPMGVAVQSEDYGEGNTPAHTYTFGKDTLHLNYIFWLHSPAYIGQVIQMLNNLPQGDPAGGLDARYPASTTPYLK